MKTCHTHIGQPVAKQSRKPSSWSIAQWASCAGNTDSSRKDCAVSLNLKYLIAKLNDTSRRSLENAAGLCSSRSNYNVEIEHWLLKMLETPDTDIPRLLKHFEVDQVKLEPSVVA